MNHKFKYSKTELLKKMVRVTEAMIEAKGTDCTIQEAVERVVPWKQYEAMVKEMEEYSKMEAQDKKDKIAAILEEDQSQKSEWASIYQFKISLNNIRPAIWRTFQVKSNITLRRLAATIVIVMGWTNKHVHEFTIDKRHYGLPFEDYDEYSDTHTKDEGRFYLRDFSPQAIKRFSFEYDFKAKWMHMIELEKMLEPKHNVKLPVCLKGAGKCPPEDCGGQRGYKNFLEVIGNPKHPDYKRMVEWSAHHSGGNYNPEEFDADLINSQFTHLAEMEADYGPVPRPPVFF